MVEAFLYIQSQRVHVGIWYILRAQRDPHIPTLRPKYIPYSYTDPSGSVGHLDPSFSDELLTRLAPMLGRRQTWICVFLPQRVQSTFMVQGFCSSNFPYGLGKYTPYGYFGPFGFVAPNSPTAVLWVFRGLRV